jgi:hypothetical protein
MEHPFINDLSSKTVEELQTTISGLMTKLSFAYRTGNQPLISQLHMALASYRKEHDKKLDEIFNKQNIKPKINIEKEGNS